MPMPSPHSSNPPGESGKEKAIRLTKENPFVPVGAFATTAAIVVAMSKMRKGDSRQFNYWLRVRVIAQGLTVAAIVLGAWGVGGLGRSKEHHITEQEMRRGEEKLIRERAEFEGRMKLAEDAHRGEVEAASGSGWASSWGMGKEKDATPTPTPLAEARDIVTPGTAIKEQAGGNTSSSWRRWFGFGGSGSNSGSSSESGSGSKP